MYSICVSTNLYKGMFQGTKIHIIIQIPIIYAPKNKKMIPLELIFLHFFIQITSSGHYSHPLIRSFALENTSMKPSPFGGW